MSDINTAESPLQLSLAMVYRTLATLSESLSLNGRDSWRRQTGNDALVKIDPELAGAVTKQPPSKAGNVNGNSSLWTDVHYRLFLPGIEGAIRDYAHIDALNHEYLSDKDAARYLPAFPAIREHFDEYQALQQHKAFQQNPPAPIDGAWWDAQCRTAIETAGKEADVKQVISHLPSSFLKEKATAVLEAGSDSLTGRIVLARLKEEGFTSESLRIDPRTEKYLAPIGKAESKSLYVRLRDTQLDFAELEPTFSAGKQTFATLFSAFDWYGRPEHIETILPNLTGAAAPAARGLFRMFEDIKEKGYPDFTLREPETIATQAKQVHDRQDLTQIGRLALVEDIIGENGTEGQDLRALATYLFSKEERVKAWGNAERYVPDNRQEKRSFALFQQDIADIFYMAALLEEREGAEANATPLKSLAFTVKNAENFLQISDAVQAQGDILHAMKQDWQERYTGQERLRILDFVTQSFELEATKPVPIPLEELSKGFAGSTYDATRRQYYIRYHEADETKELMVQLPPPTMQTKARTTQITYHADNENAHLSPEGLPYSAWLEVSHGNKNAPSIIPVPGRGSFDPFGRTGSPHAGEVVGYGCSVHHASLALIFAELGALGANRENLEQVCDELMQINPGMHLRKDLADYQMEQTLSAFGKEKQNLTYADYLAEHPKPEDPKRQHLTQYTKEGEKPTLWAAPQAARLSFAYPELYPQSPESLTPRSSWYDGRNATLTTKPLRWQAIKPAQTVNRHISFSRRTEHQLELEPEL